MSRKRTLSAVFVFLFVGLFSSVLFSQATGSFSGTVSDNSGAVVSGAKVTVTAPATNISREAPADEPGHFLVPVLGVGIYTVKVEAQGFRSAESRDRRLQVDERRELNFS